MMSSSVRGRRVTEPVLIQRGPSPFGKHEDFTAVWDQMGEAKSALRRAERRLEEAENLRVEPFSPLNSQAKKYHSSDKVVAVDSVPTYEFKTPQSKPKYFRDSDRDSPVTKKVTIKDTPDVPSKDFTSKDSKITSGYRSRSPVPNYGQIETRARNEINGGTAYLDRESDWLNSEKYLGHDATDNRLRFTLKESETDKQAAAKMSDLDVYNEFGSKFYTSPNYHERSMSAIDDSTEIRVLNDIPHRYTNGEFSRKKASQTDFTSAYSRLYGHEPGEQNITTPVHSSPRFDSKGLSKVREQVERQRQMKNSESIDDYVPRPRHRDNDPVNFTPSASVYHVPQTSILSSKQPKVRKVASAPPAPQYKGFNQAETKYVAVGKSTKDGEMKRKTRTKAPGQAPRKEDFVQRPQRPTQKISKSSSGANEDKKKMTRKVQRISESHDKKPHRTDRQGTISTRSWREGQKLARKVLGPPPKKPRSQAPQKKEETKYVSEDEDDVIKKLESIPDRHDKKDVSDEEISQHTIESDKATKTHALSEEAKDVLDDLHLDKSESEDSDHENIITNTKPWSEKRKQGTSLKKVAKPEPQYPIQKVRSYDGDEVRKFMAKQQADRRKKQQEDKKQLQLAKEKQKKQLEDLYKKQKQSVKINEKKKALGKKRLDETFSKGPYSIEDLPKRHPFPADRKRVELSGSDKENKGLWSTSSSSHSDDSVIPSTPRSERTGSPSPLHHRDNMYLKTRPATKTSSTDNLTLGFDREFDRQDLMRRPYSSSMTDLRLKGAASSGLAGSRSAGSRSKADRLAAIKDMASALQGRIEAEARRLAGELDTSANKSGLDVSGGDRWAYSSRIPKVTIADDLEKPPRYERITGRLGDHAVFTSDLPGVGSLSSHAILSSEQEKENEAATKIQAAYRGHHVRQGLMWKLPSGLTLGEKMHTRDEDLPIKFLSGGLDISPDHSDSEFIREDMTTETASPQFRELLGGIDQRHERPTDLDLHRDLLSMSANRRDLLRSSYGQPKPDGLSVIDIYTRRYEEALKDPTRKYKDPSIAADQSVSLNYSYDEDFTDVSVSKTQGLSHKSSPGTHPISQRSLSKAVSYSEDFTSSATSTQSKKTGSEKVPRVRGQVKRSSGKKSPHSHKEDTLEEVSYSQSFSSSEEESLKTSMKRSRTPSPRTVSGKSMLSRTKSPDVTGRKSPNERRSPISRMDAQSPLTLTDRLSPVSERKSPTNGSLQKSPISRDQGNGFQPVEDEDEEDIMEAARRHTRQDPREQRVYRPVPYGLGRQTTEGPPRLAPSALELKMAAELNLLESMEESMRQLTEVERTRAVSLAQQESVSLAQILKARQQSHERELQLLSLKARQEAEEASRQLEEARLRAAAAAAQAEKTLAQVKKDATDSVNETAHKLMQSQSEAAKVTAEAAKQLAEARHTSLEHVAAMQKFDPTKVAADTASAAAAAAVTAALEKQRQQQLERWKEIRTKKSKALSDYSTSSGATTSRTESQTPSSSSSKYSSDFTDYISKSTNNKDKGASLSPSYSERYKSEQTSPKDKDRKDKDVSISESVKTAEDLSRKERQRDRQTDISTASSIQTAADTARSNISTASSIQTAEDTARSNSNSSIKTASGLSVDRDNSQKSDLSIQTDPSVVLAKDSSKSESITEDISITKGSEDYSMTFDSHTEDDIEEKSFRMVLPSESHRRHSSKGRHSSQSDHASSSDELTLTNDSGKWPVDDMSSPFSAEESFNKFTAEMVKQYMREEELRAQHQAALLRLREKALKEKTKAEMAWIDHQKKRLKDKGTDEAMPPLRKKQRGLLLKLKQEQAEIDRLKAANKAASQERKLLLYQQQEISRIRKSAQVYWGRVKGNKPVADDTRSGDDISIGLDDSISDLSSPSPTKLDREDLLLLRDSKLDSSQLSASEKQAKVMQKLKKMKKQSNEKYLTRREQKLLKKEKAKAKKKLDEEEMKVQTMEKEALKLLEEKAKAAKEGKPTDRKKKDTEGEDDKSPRKESKISEKDESSITEDISQVSSIPEDIPSETQTDKNSFPVQTGNGFSSDDTTITEDYANEKFESVDTSVTATNRTLSLSPRRTPRSLSSLPLRYPLSPVRTRRDEESGSEESFSLTQSETTSDLSDVEGRIAALKDALRKRKMEVERLRKQQKKRHRERLRAREASLKKQLEAYENYIEKTKAELVTEREPDKNTVKPQIKQPKAAESKRIKEQISPRQLKQKLEQVSPAQSSPDRKSEIDSASTSSKVDNSAKDVTDSYTGFSSTAPAATVPTEDIQPSEVSQKRRAVIHRHDRSYTEDSFSDSISIILGPKGPEVISPRPPPPRTQSPDSRPTSIMSDYTDASDIPEDLPVSARSVKSGISDFLTPRLPDIQEKSDISTETGDRSQKDKSLSEGAPSQTQDSEIAEEMLSAVSTTSSQPEVISPRISLKQPTEEPALTPRKEDIKSSVTESPDKSLTSEKTVSPDKSTPERSIADLDRSVSPDKSQEQSFQTSLSQDKSEFSESERSVSSTISKSRSESRSYTYSEDFTETSIQSETEDDISEHVSEASLQSVSEKSAELIIDLKATDTRQKDYEPEKEVSEEKKDSEITLEPMQHDDKEVDIESGTITPVDDDRTPVASPTPQDELEAFRLGDRVLVGEKQPGTLRFKGTTAFAPGVWGGVELDAQKGTNDGSIDGHSYFKCGAGYGIFAPPHKLSLMPDDYRYEETESEIESIEDEIRGTPERASQDLGIMEEEDVYRYETSESSVSKQTIKSATATDGKKEVSDLDSTMDDSELERIITHSAAAVEAFSKSPQTTISVDEGEHSQEEALPLPTDEETGKENLEGIVDNITDQLTTAVVKDTLSHMTNLTDRKTVEPSKETEKERTPLLEMLVEDKEVPTVVPEIDTTPKQKTQKSDNVVCNLTKTLLTEAVAQMQAIRKQRDEKVTAQNQSFEDEEGRVTPLTDIEQPPLVPTTPSPDRDHREAESPFPPIRAETPYTPSPVDMLRRDEEEEPLSDEMFNERVKVEDSHDDASFPEPVARPSSPVPGETGDSWKMLEDDLADVLGGGDDGEWFDDDFGSMPRSNSIVKVPQRQSQGKDPLDVSSVVPGELSASDINRVDLQKLAEELFYAVPHNQQEVTDLCAEALKLFYDKQESGEPLTNVRVPDTFLGPDTKGSDTESISRKAYKDMVFHLTGEVFKDIYTEDYNTNRPSWMKPKRVIRKYYQKPKPPSSYSELATIVRENVLYLLGLRRKPQTDLISLKWINKKKKDHVDEILTEELREEEPEWVNYDDDELAVKMQLADSIMESLLTDTVTVLSTISDRRKARQEDDVPITTI